MPVTAPAPHTFAPAAQNATEAGSAARRSQLLWLDEEESNALPVFTLLLWLACLLIGVLGFVLHYERPRPRKPPEEPLLAQQLQVELAPEPPPDPNPAPPDPLAPPPPPDALAPPSIAQPIAVAQPNPAIAFALPVAGPTRVVDASRAEYASRPAVSVPTASPAVKQLILGEGEGNQPKPDYPRRAEIQRQEGAVLVRLAVGEDGRVLSAEAVEPSLWPLLNEAALKVVRERWRFTAGPARLYEVTIRFTLSK